MAKIKAEGKTTPTQFRLKAETLAKLDEIAAHYSSEHDLKITRSDAVRIAANNEHKRLFGPTLRHGKT